MTPDILQDFNAVFLKRQFIYYTTLQALCYVCQIFSYTHYILLKQSISSVNSTIYT